MKSIHDAQDPGVNRSMVTSYAALFVVLVCLVAVCACWWLSSIATSLQGSYTSGDETATATVTANETNTRHHTIEADDGLAVGSLDSRVDAHVVEHPARLRVRVVSQEFGEPLEGVRIYAIPVGSSYIVGTRVAASDARPGEAPWTGSDGTAVLEISVGVALDIVARAEQVGMGAASTTLQPLSSGDISELRLAIPTLADLSLFGRVVADESGLPLSNATIIIYDPPSGQRVVEFSIAQDPLVSHSVESDIEGTFHVSAPSWRSLIMGVHKPEHAPRFAEIQGGHEAPQDALIVRLMRSASAAVRVIDEYGAPLSGCTVAFRVDGRFVFEGTQRIVPALERTAETSDDGSCLIVELQPYAPYVIEVNVGSRVVHRSNLGALFTAGEARAMDLVLNSTGWRVEGIMVDQDDIPVRDYEVWIAPAIDSGNTVFEVGDEVYSSAVTDARGHFVFHGIHAGEWWLGPAARRSLGDTADATLVAPSAIRIDVPADGSEFVMRVDRGLFIDGHVVDAEGRLASDVLVVAKPDSVWHVISALTSSEGHFSVGPLRNEHYDLHAVDGTNTPSVPLSVVPPHKELVLQLRDPNRISGRVHPGNHCLPSEAVLLAFSGSEGRPAEDRIAVVSATTRAGAYEMTGMNPGTYCIVARSVGKDACVGMREDIQIAAGTTQSNLEIVLGRGGRLRLHLAGQNSALSLQVFRDKSLVYYNDVFGGTHLTESLPVGWYKLQLVTRSGQVVALHEFNVVADEITEVVAEGR